MQAPVLELLRCEAGHAATPLVAAVSRRAGATLLDAALGCPACGARHAVTDGVAILGASRGPPGPPEGQGRAGDEAVMRLAALLDLATPGGVVALAPGWAAEAHPLAALADVAVLALGDAVAAGPGVSPVRGVQVPPVAAATLRGVALDASIAAPAGAEGWVRAVRPGGRVVGDAGIPVPAGVRELARDDRHWVGTREVPPTPPVALARRGGEAPRSGDYSPPSA